MDTSVGTVSREERPAAHAAPHRSPLPGGVAGALAALPTALALVLLLLVSTSRGAFLLRDWGPLAIFILITLAVAGASRPLRGGPLIAVGALWAFAVYTLLSALWGESPGHAVEGGARNLLYAGLFTLPVLTMPDRHLARRLSAGLVAGLAAVVLITYFNVLADGASMYLAGRLDDPVGYRNGTAALLGIAFWPLVCVTAVRQTPAALRALTFGVAVMALGLAFATQSRGVVLGFVVGGIVAVVLGPERVRRTWLGLLATAAIFVISDRLLVPYDTFVAERVQRAEEIRAAAEALGLVSLVAVVVMFVLALLDGGLRVSAGSMRAIRGVAIGALAVLAIGGVVTLTARVGDPVDYVSEKLDEFGTGETAAPVPGQSRITTTSGPRSALWKVAVKEWEAHPAIGVGEGSYLFGYYRQRTAERNVSDPHSLVLKTLAELGLVGAALFLAFLAGLAFCLLRGLRRLPYDSRRWMSALAAGATVLLAQATVDWLWIIPALTGFALMCAGLGVALATAPETAPPPVRRPLWRRLPSLAPLAAAVLVALLFLSDYQVRKARKVAETSVAEQLSAARTAARLDPFALTPRYLEAGALESAGRVKAARQVLRDAIDLEPTNFTTYALIGDLEVRAGRGAAARRWYARASAMNPRDVGLSDLARGIRR